MTLPPSFDNFQSAWNIQSIASKTILFLTTKLIEAEKNIVVVMKHKMLRSLVSSPDQTQSTKVSILHLKHLCLKHLRFHLLSSNKPNSVSNLHTYIVATTVILLNIVARESEMRIKRPLGWHKKNSRCHRVNRRFFSQDGYAFPAFAYRSIHNKTDWFADSGATQHMTDQRHLFNSFIPVTTGNRPVIGIGTDNAPLNVQGHGTIKIRSKVDGTWHEGTLHNVLYVPNIGVNLFSIGAAADMGLTFTIDKKKVDLFLNSKLVATGTRVGKEPYLMDIEAVSPITTPKQSLTALIFLNIWHRRFGHVHNGAIQKMSASGYVDGLNLDATKVDPSPCGCAFGKSHRQPFPTEGRTRGTAIGELVHTDVCGPMSVASPGGSRYFIVFKDDFTGFRSLYFMKQKSEAFHFFKQFSSLLKTQTGHVIKTLRSDNGGEYINGEFAAHLAKEGIRKESSAPYTP
jgi:hypothetical protein